MKILIIILIIILVSAVPVLIHTAGKLEELRQKYMNGIYDFIAMSKEYKGTVLGRVKGSGKAIVIQFRDEKNHRTLVHKYMFSHKRYRRGAEVQLFYREDNDSMCVMFDNPFALKAFRCALKYALCVLGAILCIAAAVFLVIGLVMGLF